MSASEINCDIRLPQFLLMLNKMGCEELYSIFFMINCHVNFTCVERFSFLHNSKDVWADAQRKVNSAMQLVIVLCEQYMQVSSTVGFER